MLVPRGDDPPYAVDDNKIYVRDEAETGLAVRDEIVGLVLRGQRTASPTAPVQTPSLPEEAVDAVAAVTGCRRADPKPRARGWRSSA